MSDPDSEWSVLSAIDTFAGDAEGISVREFVDLINIAGTLGKWADATRCQVARLRMRGAARQLLESDPEINTTVIWPTFVTALKERFKSRETTTTLAQRFYQCDQRTGESVMEYATRIKRLSNQLNESYGTPANTTERDVRRTMMAANTKEVFMRGLNSKIRRQVLSRDPATLEVAITAAIQEELSAALDERSVVPVFTVALGNYYAEDEWTREESPRDRGEPAGNYTGEEFGYEYEQRDDRSACGSYDYRGCHGRNEGTRLICYRCGKPNHLARECWAPVSEMINQ